MTRPGTVVAAIVATALAAAVLVASYLGGWWVARDAANRRYDVNTHTQQYQSALVAQERDRSQGIATSTDAGLRKNLTLTFCTVYQDLTQPPVDLTEDYDRLCR